MLEGVDYTVNYALGFITMKGVPNTGDAIAVAYAYSDPATGAVVEVGELNPQSSSRTYLKLIRPSGMTTTDRAWPLTMRNIYSLGVRGITQEGFELEIADVRTNVPVVNLPGRTQNLIEDLGLDRQNIDGSVGSDQLIDFTGITLDAGEGRIMFPYLEPFGDRILNLLQSNPSLDDSARQALAFTELYDLKATDARNNQSKNSFYLISGVSAGGVSGTYNLSFGLIEGSVKVTANGVTLAEGVDYEVDYSFGLLTILNDKYLVSGQDIEVEFESNQFVIIGQKNFTGIRAEYSIGNNVKLGSTYFRLREQPLSDKIRIGNEPINNTIIGLDASGDFDAPWLTRAIDKIPLLQTRTSSNFSFSGEFAQLRPGVAQTNAVEEAISRGDLFKDEENGLVFIDDFEGAEYSISFMNPTRWNLAAAPSALPGIVEDDAFFQNTDSTTSQTPEIRKLRSDMRSQFSWYSIPRNLTTVNSSFFTPETFLVAITDVFQGRQILNEPNELTTLDIYYDPATRGQYNYNPDLKNLLELNPQTTWGGMTAVIPPGQEDLVQNNIEFLEFWVQAILPGGQDPTGLEAEYDGKIYIDLGTISEDIIPNTRINTEDGFSTIINNLVEDDPSGIPRSYISASGNPPTPLGQFSNDQRAQEDVGLDGAPNPGTVGAEDRDESVLFADFIEQMRISYGEGSEEFQRILEDPSNDDYVYYGENSVSNLNLNERFFRLLGYHDGNTPESGSGDGRTAITLRPDTEGLVSNSSIQQTNAYYQYELDFNPADVNNLTVGSEGTYIVDRLQGSEGFDTWYQIRIPLTDFKRKYGDIESFQNISHMRVWMSGYRSPFTLRFATFEFIGSQWNKISNLPETPPSLDNFEVSTINIEENASTNPGTFPYRQPEGSIRAVNRGAQVQTLANEQSLVLRVENLGSGQLHMVKKVFVGGLNLLNYSNMRMFVHGEGFDNRGDVLLVVRIGNDLENNYYEYRQPVSPSQLTDFNSYPNNQSALNADAREIWRYEENSMNILVSAFNVLKQLRNSENIDPSLVYEPDNAGSFLGDDIAPGATIAIKGNPSLDNVTELGLGILNPHDPLEANSAGVANVNAEFWLNELRVSGFDNENGWAANARSSVKFADFATLNANVSRQTNGFGGLESRFEDRSISDRVGVGISSTINLHKLVPDRYGWNFPVTISTRSDVQTPKYLPDQGDVRLSDFIDAVNADQTLTSDQKTDSINTRINQIQTTSESFSINFSDISKRNSKSNLAKYTIDNMRLTYVYNTSNSKNPQLRFQNKWDYRASFSYNLALRRTRLITPFGFTRNIPIVKGLSGLRIGYLPSSFTFSSSLVRNYSERRNRNLNDPDEPQALQQTHAFNQQNSFGLNYNLTPSIPISFRSSTSFDLGNVGIESRNVTGIDSASYDVVPTFEVLSGIVSDTLTARRSSYQESYTAGWRPNFSRIDALNWLTYSLSYSGGFQWANSPRGSNLGANLSNTFQIDNSIRINTDNIFNRLGFYTKMKQRNEDETEERKDARDRRRQEIADGVADSLRTPAEPPNLLKDSWYLGRKLILSVMSMKEISGGYKRSKTGSQPGYDGVSQIYYAFNTTGSDNYSPPFSYRTGFADRISESQLISNLDGDANVQLPANNSYTDTFTASTRISPFPNMTIDFDWSASISSRKTETFTVNNIGEINSVVTESGSYNVSSWSFGNGYSDLFGRQLEAAYQDISGGSTVIQDSTGNADGRTVLNRNTLQDDFRKAYLGDNVRGRGDKGFFTIPMPGWRVSWNRFEQYIPIIGQYMTSATLTHSYRGTYKVDWALNSITGLQSPQSLGSTFQVADVREKYEPTAIRVERRFNPLVKLSMTWKSNLRTEFGYNRGNISTLALSSTRVTETLTQGIDFATNYTFRNVRISFLPKVKNNIDIGMRASYSNDSELNYELDTDLGGALTEASNPTSSVGEAEIISARETGQQRINGTFTLGYVISSSITSNFEYTYSRIESNNIPTRTNHDIRFNIRIAIRSR
ncbi:MAG: cell surface protein SprA [Balneolales bacterium]|nr:cell surface protein SprA [Balneolales bacterium]